jgi:hypothetical protein
MNFNYDQFISDANHSFILHSENQRYGQFLVNELREKHPEINLPDSADCFYDNGKVKDFLIFIHSLDNFQ